MSFPKHLECNLCGNQQPYEPLTPAICKRCNSQWLEARYDYDAFKRELLRIPFAKKYLIFYIDNG